MAQEAGIDKLVLSHMGPNIASPGSLEKDLRDVKNVYDGEAIVAEELMRLDL